MTDKSKPEPLYYLQALNAGYVGNSPCFWHKSDSGYTPLIDDAKLFTADEVRKIKRSTRGTHKWKRWTVRDIERATVRVVDAQLLPAGKHRRLARSQSTGETT